MCIAVADAADRWLDPGLGKAFGVLDRYILAAAVAVVDEAATMDRRSEEHTSELQSLMRISYAVFCLKKQNKTHNYTCTTFTQYSYFYFSKHVIISSHTTHTNLSQHAVY